MKRRVLLPLLTALALVLAVSARADIKVTVDHNDNEHAKPEFKFAHVPSPSEKDAATKAKFSIVEGERDPNGGELEVLNDGKLPAEEDQPAANFFFNAGTEGGRIGVDLGSVIDIKQVNTYSWHPNTRGPQFYKLYASDGKAAGFNAEPKKGTNPETAGWTLVASVDTRPKEGEGGGQYGVSIADTDAKETLGKYRYLLLDCFRTEADDGFGNTFFSEIDVVAADNRGASAKELIGDPAKGPGTVVVVAGDGKYRITIDYSDTPELEEWATKELAPVVKAWYPQLVEALPSEGYEAPKQFSVTFRKDAQGVAYTAGTRVVGAYGWFSKNLKGEGKGAIVHELVHVVQQYGQARRTNPNAQRNPGWLVEGIPDYLRWYKYEPESHGAEITKRNFARAKYDGSYRITANFLNYVIDKYDQKDLIPKLNAAMRQGKYSEELWKQFTGKTVQELGEEWKAGIAKSLGIEATATAAATAITGTVAADAAAGADAENKLTDDEKKAGWKLLFDGKSLDGWHTFKRQDIKPGWQVKDGTIACIDPHNAGDLCTNDPYGWFELQLDYNISEGGNSGIMYHVTDKGGAAWATGPEFQLEDNAKAADPIRCGWLYALYQPPIDPATGKPLDATKPAGQWNHVRLLLSPEKCVHEINGVKYFEYVLGSDDFKARVAKSKFSKMPDFAKFDAGYIALQGDHGQVSFRNVKVRVIEGEKK